ncbi:MAG TPA: D-2-hydroxyacid dehydrogenase [Anaerolineales bacterium]|nr:D-2-hydroxyacid dehydrogenase [Anaerolineales bacterium]
MPKLLILSRQAEEYQHLLESADLPEIQIFPATEVVKAKALDPDFEIVFGEPRLMREVLPGLPRLRWVQSMYAGVEHLLDPALRRDYMLTNARGVFGTLMSEYVFGYLLNHERRIFERRQAQQEHRWDGSTTGMLRGKTIGLLGVGSIGAHLARAADFFEMTVRGYTRSSESCPAVDVYFHGGRLLDFANGLDYLVSVLPNTSGTRHIVDAALLEALPPRAVFVNVGRGSALDESALIHALETKRIAAAVLDVFEQEPLPKDHPFWEAPNLLMTFHTSAPSLTADIAGLFIENYRLYLNRKELLHRVDFGRGY